MDKETFMKESVSIELTGEEVTQVINNLLATGGYSFLTNHTFSVVKQLQDDKVEAVEDAK